MNKASVSERIALIARDSAEGAACAPELNAGPWEFDAQPPAYGPGASMGDVIPVGTPRQGALPNEYKTAGNDELHERIRAAKRETGEIVCVGEIRHACSGEIENQAVAVGGQGVAHPVGVRSRGAGVPA